MNTTVRCIAIDDEPLALDVIQKFCARMTGFVLTAYSDPEEGLTAILSEKPDIVFLDIEMENVTGLAIARKLPKETCIIFTTAYLNYALEGFNLDAVDYLHKPFAFSRFQAACTKAMRRIEFNAMNSASQTIVVKQEYNNVTIQLNDILYIEAMEGYSKIHRLNGKPILSRGVLKSFGDRLSPTEFVRTHRSYIVAAGKVKSFNKQALTLVNGVTLPVGRQYSENIVTLLSK
ncbi:MAG: LytTR family DNA-binding domain-containing protein [Bacteroidales bacterium]|nr:LytTR family DNA-binding domain-containing protein [Bacteroidales bacterium]MCM1147085.1 LytTR family DNA-binding domain-containing protein [Bacteroidales bacterium]MCM1205781.1 LytTR family DNA-binding domain-containing protein [Bacillota bacterium]